jgi:hypothetical protein
MSIEYVELTITDAEPIQITVSDIPEPSPSSGGGGGGSLTVREVDGSPSGTASTLVFPNGTVSIGGTTATITGLQGASWQETFETVSQSLSAYPATINYSSSRVSTIVYTLPGPTTITKTINYTGDKVTSIVLSGATPSGISLTKTLTYTGDNVTGVAYS